VLIEMKVGQLIWNASNQRVDIVFRDGSLHGGLHCGYAFDVLIKDVWQPTRIEYSWNSDSWYLVGIDRDEEILGLTVKL
jgi:hypothetical protein